MRTRTGRSDAATTAIVGFAVVLVIFVTSLAAFLSVFQAPQHRSSEQPFLDAQASSGLVDILDTTGYRVNGAVRAKDWQAQPDQVTRFGLARDGDPGMLDVGKLRNATRGGHDKAANGLLDYEEVRASLGLKDAQFHLRTHPMWDPLAGAGPTPLNLTVAYLGDFTSTPGGPQSNYPVLNVSAVNDLGEWVYVNVTITNNGTTATAFQVRLHVPLDEDDLEDPTNTGLLAPGQSWLATLKLRKSLGWSWASLADPNVHVLVYDPVKKVGDHRLSLLANAMNVAPDNDRVALTVDPQKLLYKSNEFPKVRWKYWDPAGEDENSPEVNLTVSNAVSGAVLWYYQGDPNSQEYQFPAKLAEGYYNVSVRLVGDAQYTANDTVVVEDDAVPGQFVSAIAPTITEGSLSKWERGLLVSLVAGFRNTTYDSGSGHVYHDFPSAAEGALADRLNTGLVDVLLLGSAADHASLDGASIQTAIREHVHRGGLVISLGSAAQSPSWLGPLLDATTASTTGPTQADPTHPLLHLPEELAWDRYLGGGRAWRLDSPGPGGHFTPVVGTTSGATLVADLLASRAGHFGDGNVLLTSWQLGALTGDLDRDEALAALYNLLLFANGALYLDLGPPVPPFAEVAGVTRIATAPDQVLPGERLLVRVSLQVFR